MIRLIMIESPERVYIALIYVVADITIRRIQAQ